MYDSSVQKACIRYIRILVCRGIQIDILNMVTSTTILISMHIRFQKIELHFN